MIKYDIITGTFKRWPFLLGYAAFSLAFYLLPAAKEQNIDINQLLFYFYGGVKSYFASDGLFTIPPFWLFYQLFILYSISDFPLRDLQSEGIQVLIRTKSRTQWWISKCFWIIFEITLLYIINWSTLFILSFAYKVSFSSFDTLQIISIFILPLMVNIANGMVNLTLGFIFKPIYAFIISVVIIICGIYSDFPILLIYYSMQTRNTGESSYFINGLLISLTIVVISSIIGVIRIKKKDLI
jgi:hypothetical protein